MKCVCSCIAIAWVLVAGGAGLGDANTNFLARTSSRTLRLSYGLIAAEEDFNGLLLRELARQSILIAASDQLHVPVWDDVSDGDIAENCPADYLHLKLSETISNNLMHVVVARVATNHEEKVVYSHNVVVNDSLESNYFSVVVELERLSREEFPNVLTKLGLTVSSNSASCEAGGLSYRYDISQMNALCQWKAARYAHDALLSKQRSPESLACLTHAYANLGQITRFHWSSLDKVFTARSLIYARKGMVEFPDSPESIEACIYACALGGLQSKALSMLEACDDFVFSKDSVRKKALSAFCRHEMNELLSIARSNSDDQSIWLMVMLLAKHSLSHSYIGTIASECVEHLPACMLGYDILYLSEELGCQRAASSDAPMEFEIVLSDMLSGKNTFGNCVTTLVWGDSVEPSGGRLATITGPASMSARRALISALIDDASLDSCVPSYATLATLIDDITFLNAKRRMFFLVDSLSVSAENYVTEITPVLEDHRYWLFLKAYTHSKQCGYNQRAVMCQGMKTVDPKWRMESLGGFLGGYHSTKQTGKYPGVVILRSVCNNADRTSDDLHYMLGVLRRSPHNAENAVKMAKRLLDIDPYSPLAAIVLIEFDDDWRHDNIDRVREKLSYDPGACVVIAAQYAKCGDNAAAEEVLCDYLEDSVDQLVLVKLAELYEDTEQWDKWLATNDRLLALPCHGLMHARINRNIAYHYMTREEFEKALPYATAAAQTWASWGMLCAVDCCEGMQNWSEAELWVKRTSQRYASSRMLWYLWCQRTEKGDIDGAREYFLADHDRMIESVEYPDMVYVAVLEELEGRDIEATRRWEKAFKKTCCPFCGLNAALGAWSIGDTEKRDDILKQIKKRGLWFRLRGKQRRQLAMLSLVLEKDLDGTLGLDFMKQTEGMARQEERDGSLHLTYVAGRYLDLKGDKASAEEKYLKCLSDPEKNHLSITLAAFHLRSIGGTTE